MILLDDIAETIRVGDMMITYDEAFYLQLDKGNQTFINSFRWIYAYDHIHPEGGEPDHEKILAYLGLPGGGDR